MTRFHVGRSRRLLAIANVSRAAHVVARGALLFLAGFAPTGRDRPEDAAGGGGAAAVEGGGGRRRQPAPGAGAGAAEAGLPGPPPRADETGAGKPAVDADLLD